MSSAHYRTRTDLLLHRVSVRVEAMTFDLRMLHIWLLVVAVMIVLLVAGYAERWSEGSEQLQRDTETQRLQIAGQATWPEKAINAPANRSHFSDPFAGDWRVWSLCEPGMR